MAEYILKEEIISRSVSDDWFKAKNEWQLGDLYMEHEPNTCLCGHYPITEICVLVNCFNGNNVIVGNCCVKKFLGLPSGKIFQAIKKIKKDSDRSLNEEAITYFYNAGQINSWEYAFYMDIWRKRKLSFKQLRYKRQINDRICKMKEVSYA